MTKQTLQDLQRIAIAKHGEDRAHSIAYQKGNPRHKKTWQEVIAHPVQTAEEKLSHQIWQQKTRDDFKQKWQNDLKQQFE